MKKNNKGFGVVEGLLILVIAGLLVGLGWYIWKANNKDKQNSNSQTSQAGQSGSGTTLTRNYLPFTIKYPANWEVGGENTTDYGFYSINLQAKGTVIETGSGGAVLKSGAQISLIETSDKTVDPERTIDDYATKSTDAKYLVNKKTITLDGVQALEYDLDRTSTGGTSGHLVRFYKSDVLYIFSMDNQQYTQSQYGSIFDGIVKSTKFK